MKTIRLGKTGLEVSRVGIGGIPIQRPPEEEAIKVIQRALDLGVNLIDTSIGYGDSEERIGKGITGRREQVIIATKGRWKDKATLESCHTTSARFAGGQLPDHRRNNKARPRMNQPMGFEASSNSSKMITILIFDPFFTS